MFVAVMFLAGVIASLPRVQEPACETAGTQVKLTLLAAQGERPRIAVSRSAREHAAGLNIDAGFEICIADVPEDIATATDAGEKLTLRIADPTDRARELPPIPPGRGDCQDGADGRCVVFFEIGGSTLSLLDGPSSLEVQLFLGDAAIPGTLTVGGAARGAVSATRLTYEEARTFVEQYQERIAKQKCGARPLPVVAGDSPATQSKAAADPPASGSAEARAIAEKVEEWEECRRSVPRGSHYDVEGDSAVLFFDDSGRLIEADSRETLLLANFDQDDVFRIHVVHRAGADKFAITRLSGDFAPTSLAAGPTPALPMRGDASTQSTGGESRPESRQPEIQTVSALLGPFTSEQMSFAIQSMRGDSTVVRQWVTTVRINPIVHVGYELALVASHLRNPEFLVVPHPDTASAMTIVKVEDRWQVKPVFHVALYSWRVWEGRRALARGRDLLKEPSFLERIYPTFGVAVTDPLENLYGGFVFEVARGAGILGGVHVGQVRRLLVPRDFELGAEVFAGAEDDIRTDERWGLSWFLGITADIRILRQLLGGES